MMYLISPLNHDHVSIKCPIFIENQFVLNVIPLCRELVEVSVVNVFFEF